jgi:hypothetical protein
MTCVSVQIRENRWYQGFEDRAVWQHKSKEGATLLIRKSHIVAYNPYMLHVLATEVLPAGQIRLSWVGSSAMLAPRAFVSDAVGSCREVTTAVLDKLWLIAACPVPRPGHVFLWVPLRLPDGDVVKVWVHSELDHDQPEGKE